MPGVIAPVVTLFTKIYVPPVAMNGKVAAVLKIETPDAAIYIVVYVPSGQTAIFVCKSSSCTTAASKPGVTAKSDAVFAVQLPAVTKPPESTNVPNKS